jgi:phytochrome-interacting factor 4
MQSQTNRKLPPRPEKPTPGGSVLAPATAPEDEAGLWLPFALADSLDKDIFSDFFCEAPVEAGKPPCREGVVVPPPEDSRTVSEAPPRDLMPPPKSTPHVSCSRQQQTTSLGERGTDHQAGASSSPSMLSAIGSSICGSNQVLVPRRAAPDATTTTAGYALPSTVGSANPNAAGGHEATAASSSGRSNGCFGATTTTEPTSTTNRSGKRKRLDTEDSESPTSKDTESESAAAAARKPMQKLAMVNRRRRAAEVHNLSERVCTSCRSPFHSLTRIGRVILTLKVITDDAEETRQDQREDASLARAHTAL